MLVITGISVVRGSAGVGGWQPSHEAVGTGRRHAICAGPRTPTTWAMKERPYQKYVLMLGISFLVMYSVMFLNVASLAHIHLSLTRFYMTLLMIAPMAVMMLLMMGHMYPNKGLNKAILVSSVAVFALALIGLRAQVPIGDTQYMRAMIPHHSSAILTSEEADLRDPEVSELAEDIIAAQEREIAQMEAILSRMK
jgi:small-conductance mechanosensitive channel